MTKGLNKKDGMLMVHSDCVVFFVAFDLFSGLLLFVSVIVIVVCFC